jgi:hypothetical protein
MARPVKLSVIVGDTEEDAYARGKCITYVDMTMLHLVRLACLTQSPDIRAVMEHVRTVVFGQDITIRHTQSGAEVSGDAMDEINMTWLPVVAEVRSYLSFWGFCVVNTTEGEYLDITNDGHIATGDDDDKPSNSKGEADVAQPGDDASSDPEKGRHGTTKTDTHGYKQPIMHDIMRDAIRFGVAQIPRTRDHEYFIVLPSPMAMGTNSFSMTMSNIAQMMNSGQSMHTRNVNPYHTPYSGVDYARMYTGAWVMETRAPLSGNPDTPVIPIVPMIQFVAMCETLYQAGAMRNVMPSIVTEADTKAGDIDIVKPPLPAVGGVVLFNGTDDFQNDERNRVLNARQRLDDMDSDPVNLARQDAMLGTSRTTAYGVVGMNHPITGMPPVQMDPRIMALANGHIRVPLGRKLAGPMPDAKLPESFMNYREHLKADVYTVFGIPLAVVNGTQAHGSQFTVEQSYLSTMQNARLVVRNVLEQYLAACTPPSDQMSPSGANGRPARTGQTSAFSITIPWSISPPSVLEFHGHGLMDHERAVWHLSRHYNVPDSTFAPRHIDPPRDMPVDEVMRDDREYERYQQILAFELRKRERADAGEGSSSSSGVSSGIPPVPTSSGKKSITKNKRKLGESVLEKVPTRIRQSEANFMRVDFSNSAPGEKRRR